MPIPRPLLHTFLLLVFPTILLAFSPSASALGPSGDAFLGYSRTTADAFYSGTGGLNGWEGAFQLKLRPFIGVEGDVSHYGLGAAVTVPSTTAALFGPRLTVGALGIKIFAHALIGGEHTGSGSSGVSTGALAVALGGGLDMPLLPFFAWRVAGDYLNTPTQSSGSGAPARFSTGIVFRF